jgi:hypothetical protein
VPARLAVNQISRYCSIGWNDSRLRVVWNESNISVSALIARKETGASLPDAPSVTGNQ